jgi:hypothetical protein
MADLTCPSAYGTRSSLRRARCCCSQALCSPGLVLAAVILASSFRTAAGWQAIYPVAFPDLDWNVQRGRVDVRGHRHAMVATTGFSLPVAVVAIYRRRDAGEAAQRSSPTALSTPHVNAHLPRSSGTDEPVAETPVESAASQVVAVSFEPASLQRRLPKESRRPSERQSSQQVGGTSRGSNPRRVSPMLR